MPRPFKDARQDALAAYDKLLVDSKKHTEDKFVERELHGRDILPVP